YGSSPVQEAKSIPLSVSSVQIQARGIGNLQLAVWHRHMALPRESTLGVNKLGRLVHHDHRAAPELSSAAEQAVKARATVASQHLTQPVERCTTVGKRE